MLREGKIRDGKGKGGEEKRRQTPPAALTAWQSAPSQAVQLSVWLSEAIKSRLDIMILGYEITKEIICYVQDLALNGLGI